MYKLLRSLAVRRKNLFTKVQIWQQWSISMTNWPWLLYNQIYVYGSTLLLWVFILFLQTRVCLLKTGLKRVFGFGSFHVKSTRGVHHTPSNFYEIFCA